MCLRACVLKGSLSKPKMFPFLKSLCHTAAHPAGKGSDNFDAPIQSCTTENGRLSVERSFFSQYETQSSECKHYSQVCYKTMIVCNTLNFCWLRSWLTWIPFRNKWNDVISHASPHTFITNNRMPPEDEAPGRKGEQWSREETLFPTSLRMKAGKLLNFVPVGIIYSASNWPTLVTCNCVLLKRQGNMSCTLTFLRVIFL